MHADGIINLVTLFWSGVAAVALCFVLGLVYEMLTKKPIWYDDINWYGLFAGFVSQSLAIVTFVLLWTTWPYAKDSVESALKVVSLTVGILVALNYLTPAVEQYGKGTDEEKKENWEVASSRSWLQFFALALSAGLYTFAVNYLL